MTSKTPQEETALPPAWNKWTYLLKNFFYSFDFLGNFTNETIITFARNLDKFTTRIKFMSPEKPWHFSFELWLRIYLEQSKISRMSPTAILIKLLQLSRSTFQQAYNTTKLLFIVRFWHNFCKFCSSSNYFNCIYDNSIALKRRSIAKNRDRWRKMKPEIENKSKAYFQQNTCFRIEIASYKGEVYGNLISKIKCAEWWKIYRMDIIKYIRRKKAILSKTEIFEFRLENFIVG